MLNRLFIFSVLMAVALENYSQGIQDSVFQLKGVEIRAGKDFDRKEAGMVVSRVDSVILLEKINQSLSELLSENTPVFIKSYGRGALATASFRGTDASHTRVSWNGMDINSPMTGMVDFSLIPVYIIDDIELRSGAASLADRSGGLGGEVMIRNQADWQNRLGVKFLQGVGSYQTFNDYLQLSLGNPAFQSRTRGYFSCSRNNYTFINRGVATIDTVTGEIVNPLDTNDNADYQLYGVLQELYYRPDGANIISLKYWYQQADRTIPQATSYEGPEHSNLNRQEDADHKLVGEWNRFGERGHLMIRSGFSHKEMIYSLKNQVPGLGEVPAIYSESRQTSLLNTVSYDFEFKNDLSVNGKLDADWHWVGSTDTVTGSGYETTRSDMSLLLGLHKGFAGRINLNLMLRQDWVDYNVTPLMPYLGFDLRLFKQQDLFLKGHVARNYRQPSLNDLYWQPGGNPALMPEKSMNYELGLEYRAVVKSHTLKVTLTGFRADIENWIMWLPSFKGYWEPRNIEKVQSTGVELMLNAAGELGAFTYKIHGNYAYTHSVNLGDPLVWGDESYGKQLPYIPLHSGNLMLNLGFRGFFITYQHNSYSERYTTSSNDITSRGSIYPYYMNDISAGKEIRIKNVTLSAEFKVQNLFNETYHTVLYRPMPGRNYMLVLLVNFNKI